MSCHLESVCRSGSKTHNLFYFIVGSMLLTLRVELMVAPTEEIGSTDLRFTLLETLNRFPATRAFYPQVLRQASTCRRFKNNVRLQRRPAELLQRYGTRTGWSGVFRKVPFDGGGLLTIIVLPSSLSGGRFLPGKVV
jgi:hypothetical protein